MNQSLRICIFAHSWRSDWNHGNAHFLRGLAQELINLGHDVRCYEAQASWSLTNLLQEGERGHGSVRQFQELFADLDIRTYADDETFPRYAQPELQGADIVLVHEWNSPLVVNTIAALKKSSGYVAFFHDTHHRAYTNRKEILTLELHEYDAVLAFGDALRRIYIEAFGVQNVWTFHEAAYSAYFHPAPTACETDIAWIGNWGDGERSRELEEFLIQPASALRDRRIAVYGVRYSEEACAKLAAAGIEYRGYLPNLLAPRVYAQSSLTLHVPRCYYSNGLSGIPTIRVFEALACGIPLVCSPWNDSDGLFRPNEDYVIAANGDAMLREIKFLLSDELARQQIAANGLETIRQRHTCAHRAQQFIEICQEHGR